MKEHRPRSKTDLGSSSSPAHSYGTLGKWPQFSPIEHTNNSTYPTGFILLMKRWGVDRWMEYWRIAGKKLGKQKCLWNNLREIELSGLIGRDRIYMGIMRDLKTW